MRAYVCILILICQHDVSTLQKNPITTTIVFFINQLFMCMHFQAY